MTIDHDDDHSLTPMDNEKRQALANYHEEFSQLLTKYVALAAPRLFALCREYCQDAEGWVYLWGVAFDDCAALFHPDGTIAGTSNTADSALNLFSRTEDLRLVWVDPTLCHQSDTAAP